ncbi:afamin-like [Lissotriton helveticus]
MKTSTCIAVLLFMFVILFFRSFCQTHRGDRYPRSGGENPGNTGCDLSLKVDASFKIRSLVDYSQKLIFNSLKDITRLRNRLLVFMSGCCFEKAIPECFMSESAIFLGRICADNISLSKNREAYRCCGMKHLDRELCFKTLQNRPPVHLPAISSHFSQDEECLAFAANTNLIVESYIHGLARRLTAFSPQMMSRIFYAYILLYITCCAQVDNPKECFSFKKEEFMMQIKNEIENENKICWQSKYGAANNTIVAVLFYAQKKPSDSWKQAMNFGEAYARFASNCCRPEFMTSDCFRKQSDVLYDHFCANSTNGPHRDCCLKRESEKPGCLSQLASQESRTILNTSLNFDLLCDLSREGQLEVFSWSTYEYSRRHTDKSINIILSHCSFISNTANQCCASKDSQACSLQVSPMFLD